MSHRSIHLLARADGNGYRRVFPAELDGLWAVQAIYNEGVDPDEQNNAVHLLVRPTTRGRTLMDPHYLLACSPTLRSGSTA